MIPAGSRNRELDHFAWRDARATTIWIAIATVICIGIGFASGRMGFDRPIDPAKLLSATGAVLAGWGTYFALHDAQTSWDEQRPDEHLRKAVFKATFIPGLFCGVLGAIL